MGAGRLKVNSIHLHHINRNQRYCSFCADNHNNNVVEDEEHVLFHCPEYDICQQELYVGTNMNRGMLFGVSGLLLLLLLLI